MNADCTKQDHAGELNKVKQPQTVTIGAQVLSDIQQLLKVINNDDLCDDCEDCQKRECVGCWQEGARELLKEVEG